MSSAGVRPEDALAERGDHRAALTIARISSAFSVLQSSSTITQSWLTSTRRRVR
jgi:hypothetical protein